MIKQVLLATSMMVAAPVLAQTQSSTGQATPGRAPMSQAAPMSQSAPATTQQAPTTSSAPTGDAMTAQTSPATPAPTAPADPVVAQGSVEPAAPQAAAPTGAAPAQSADATAAQPASGGSQVAQIVDKEFAAYDKDGDGKLSQVEFDSWMVALKTASDPTTKADSPATKQWLGAAFAQADADKNRGVTKTELTGFLSQGQS